MVSFRSVLVALFAAGVMAGEAAAQATGRITGTVTDASGLPLPGALVRALSTIGDSVAADRTSETGRYELVVPPGTYSVNVRVPGYAPVNIPQVVVAEGATVQLNAPFTRAVQLADVTVTAPSRGPERLTQAAAAVGAVTAAEIQARPTINTIQQLKGKYGIDVAETGIQSSNTVARGFNNVFSGAMLTLSDFRYAFVPSLRVNTPFLLPTTHEDIEQIEFVLGPGSALYGPNAANGVLHIISRSPFGSPGTTLSIAGGNREVVRGGLRHAQKLSDRVAFKLTGQYIRGKDWEVTDPTEQAARATALAAPGVRPDTLRVGLRDFDIERYGGEARLDLKLIDNSDWVTTAGLTHSVNALEMTGIGTAQAKDWRYDFIQSRFRWNQLFLQAFLNRSDTKDTYLLRSGQGVVDKSIMWAAQAQHRLTFAGKQFFTYGVDYQFTDPRTLGTINGRNEDRDDITEIGGYVQSETHLTPRVRLIAAGRMDSHSELEDPVFSPRAALVFSPSNFQSFRVTFNRAFNTPTTNNLFLDLIAQRVGPYNARTLGVPEGGLQFRRTCGTIANGLCIKVPGAFGNPNPNNFMPADLTPFWATVQGLLLQNGIDIRSVPAPTNAQVGTAFFGRNAVNETQSVNPADLLDIGRLKPTITSTFEAGYNGDIEGRIRLALNGYWERKTDFTGPLIVETPTAHFNAQQFAGYLIGRGIAPATASQAAAIIGPVPFGVASFDNPLTEAPELVLTYRNYGRLTRHGGDAAAEFLLTRTLSLATSYSYVNKNLWSRAEVGGIADVTLNAPRNKGALSVSYRQLTNDPERPEGGFGGELRGRWVESFPMNSGVFIGRVPTYTTVDASVSYRLPLRWNPLLTVNAQNLLTLEGGHYPDDRHLEFIGAPPIGRFVMTQLSVTF